MPAVPSTARRRGALALVAVLLVTGSLAGLPGLTGHAAAGTIDAECAGTFIRTFSPPVTTTPQTVAATSTDSYSTCVVGLAGTGLTTTTATLSCVNLGTIPAETETITWQDGGTSTIAWSAPVVAGQTLVFSGTVTAGRFAGDSAAKVTSGISYLAVVVPCLLGTPISQTTGLDDSLLLTG